MALLLFSQPHNSRLLSWSNLNVGLLVLSWRWMAAHKELKKFHPFTNSIWMNLNSYYALFFFSELEERNRVREMRTWYPKSICIQYKLPQFFEFEHNNLWWSTPLSYGRYKPQEQTGQRKLYHFLWPNNQLKKILWWCSI